MLWPGDAADEVSRGFRELALAAPNEETGAIIYLTAPAEPGMPPEMVGKMAVASSTSTPGTPRRAPNTPSRTAR